MLTIYVVFVSCFLKNDQFLWVTDVRIVNNSKLRNAQHKNQNCNMDQNYCIILTSTNYVSYNTIVLHALYEVTVAFVGGFWLRWQSTSTLIPTVKVCKWDQCENCFTLVQKEQKGTKFYLLSLTQHHLGWSAITQFVYQQGKAIKESKQWSFQTLKPYLQQFNIAPSACELNLGPEESQELIKGKSS